MQLLMKVKHITHNVRTRRRHWHSFLPYGFKTIHLGSSFACEKQRRNSIFRPYIIQSPFWCYLIWSEFPKVVYHYHSRLGWSGRVLGIIITVVLPPRTAFWLPHHFAVLFSAKWQRCWQSAFMWSIGNCNGNAVSLITLSQGTVIGRQTTSLNENVLLQSGEERWWSGRFAVHWNYFFNNSGQSLQRT